MSEYDRQLDLSGQICPLNYVKTKMALEEIEEGQILKVIIDDGEPIRNVPKSLKNDGHTITAVRKIGDQFELMIKKG